ncbi:RDD family protein [Streptomyces sp. TRM70308]|uniref:RDD family protein n=1 Tax=Streptomyces sp. TRM70308 TaxID=3131932 RepID=UPI003D00A970
MSAPPSASANGSTPAGYYPDPSIPGYIRYWDGAAWVPGTSRPEPRGGEPLPRTPAGDAAPAPASAAEPPAPAPAAPAPGPAPAAPAPGGPAAVPEQREAEGPRDETGPVFLDEEAAAAPEPSASARPEPAPAWRADADRQSGFGGGHGQKVDWGAQSAAPAPPSGPAARSAPPAASGPVAGAAQRPGAGGQPAADPRGGWQRPGHRGTAPRDRAEAAADAAPESAPGGADAAARPSGPSAPRQDDTFTLRAVRPGTLPPGPGEARAVAPEAPDRARQASPEPERPGGWARQVQELARPCPQGSAPTAPGGQGAPAAAGPPAAAASGRPGAPGPSGSFADAAPVGEQGPVTPWRPPVDDPFLRAAQAQARPAGLGRRLAARLVDTLVQGAVAAAVAAPLVPRAVDHVRAKVDAVEQAGVTRDVWLVDGTTGGYLALVVGAFLLFGLFYEALPTARWGRTLGKKLCGVQVLRVEEQTPPGFGGALTRWLLYGVLAAALVGVVNVLWCLVDRPWRQCWHDKAARTFVARRSHDPAHLS